MTCHQQPGFFLKCISVKSPSSRNAGVHRLN
jgi:hypothetical protein